MYTKHRLRAKVIITSSLNDTVRKPKFFSDIWLTANFILELPYFRFGQITRGSPSYLPVTHVAASRHSLMLEEYNNVFLGRSNMWNKTLKLIQNSDTCGSTSYTYDGLSVAEPTVLKHWRMTMFLSVYQINYNGQWSLTGLSGPCFHCSAPWTMAGLCGPTYLNSTIIHQ